MYPQRDLRALGFHKARLRRRIARRRDQCVVAAGALARPIAWLDRARECWRQVSPLVKISGLLFGLFAGRPIAAGRWRLGKWLRWGISAFGVFRGLNAMRG